MAAAASAVAAPVSGRRAAVGARLYRLLLRSGLKWREALEAREGAGGVRVHAEAAPFLRSLNEAARRRGTGPLALHASICSLPGPATTTAPPAVSSSSSSSSSSAASSTASSSSTPDPSSTPSSVASPATAAPPTSSHSNPFEVLDVSTAWSLLLHHTRDAFRCCPAHLATEGQDSVLQAMRVLSKRSAFLSSLPAHADACVPVADLLTLTCSNVFLGRQTSRYSFNCTVTAHNTSSSETAWFRQTEWSADDGERMHGLLGTKGDEVREVLPGHRVHVRAHAATQHYLGKVSGTVEVMARKKLTAVALPATLLRAQD
eukprot:TRINITY_DN5429_c0_g1_i1.p1 TRINITY_DN5429_c0_g1~~TRINITY_DN5429_c0_g1_i1.p1  ORF type:complete len:317 (+),score=77.93 TRINITY_DN5429_c0_g1_i1:194-1144(+)